MPNPDGFRTLQEVIDDAVAEFDKFDPRWVEKSGDVGWGKTLREHFRGDLVRMGLVAIGDRNTYFEIEPYTRDELTEAWRAKIAELRRTRSITMLREVRS